METAAFSLTLRSLKKNQLYDYFSQLPEKKNMILPVFWEMQLGKCMHITVVRASFTFTASVRIYLECILPLLCR